MLGFCDKLLCFQTEDLANQIWHWDQYQRTMRDLNTDVNEMRYLSVAAGEYLSGGVDSFRKYNH